MGKAKLRGKEKVQIQFLLTASALNLKKMVKLLIVDELKYSFDKTLYKFIKSIYNILKKILLKPAVVVA